MQDPNICDSMVGIEIRLLEVPMSVGEHIETLRAKHASLEEAIDQENLRPHPDDMRIQELKKEKLRIKDEIAGLSDGA